MTANHSLRLPRLGLGTAPLGNLFTAVPDDVAAHTLERAREGGIRHVDTAPHYGLGLAERRLGAALVGCDRDRLVVSTKVGRRLVPSPATAHLVDDGGFAVPADQRRAWDVTPEGLAAGLAESLDRLGLDHVDVAYLHDPDEHVAPGSTVEHVLDEALPGLLALRDARLARAIGVGSKSTAALVHAASSGAVDALMVAGRFTLLEQPALADVMPAAARADVAVVAVGVYNSGALAVERPSADQPYEYGTMPAEVLGRLRRLADVCARFGVTLPEAAVQFPFLHPAVASVVVGVRRPEEVVALLDRWAAPVPAELWSALAEEGLVDEGLVALGLVALGSVDRRGVAW